MRKVRSEVDEAVSADYTRPRKFDALISINISNVYSGGLIYEYSTEENKFGIVKPHSEGEAIDQSDEFELFKEALSKTPTPTDSSWNVDPSLVPRMTQQAEKYMKHGAGRSPGFKGGSQNAVGSGTATASVASGEASLAATGKKDDEDNAGSVRHGDKTAVAVTNLTLLFPIRTILQNPKSISNVMNSILHEGLISLFPNSYF
ncbi:glucanosyltransferase domain-containing protein [Hirsutella rhossiliensis]